MRHSAPFDTPRWSSPRLCLTLALALCAAAPTARADVTVSAVGTPAFDVVDLHLFSAPIGTLASGYAEFMETNLSILPGPHHAFNPVLGVGPGTPHAGPYTHEIADGLAAKGYATGSSYTKDQYSNGQGVFLGFMLTPNANSPTGSSPDFASGPILGGSLFPLTLTGTTYTNGLFNDFMGAVKVPAISDVDGFTTLDGHSHLPVFFADNFDFADNPVTGAYEYRISIRDAQGNGYNVSASFTVSDAPPVSQTPEPGAMLLAACGAVSLLAARQARRRACAAPA